MQTGLTAAITAFEEFHKLLSNGIHREQYLKYCENEKFDRILTRIIRTLGQKQLGIKWRAVYGISRERYMVGTHGRGGGHISVVEHMRDEFIREGVYTRDEIMNILKDIPNYRDKTHKLEQLALQWELENFHRKYLSK